MFILQSTWKDPFSSLKYGRDLSPRFDTLKGLSKWIGLIQVKEEGWTGFFEGWQGCSEGFPKGEARGKSRLFFLDLHSN